MSDDAKTASGTDVPKTATDKSKKKKKKGDSEKAPISQAVPPVVRRRNKPESVAPAAAADAAGKDAAGKDAAGKDAAGKDAAGKDAAGKDAAGKDAAGKDAAGKDAAGKGAANSATAGQRASADSAEREAKPSTTNVAKDEGAAKASVGTSADKTDAQPPSSKKAAAEGPAAALARKAAAARAAAAEAGIEVPPPAEAPVSPAADGSVAVTDATLDAELRSGAAGKSRRARKSRAVRTTDVPAESPKGEDGADKGSANEDRPRRKRRERGRGRDDDRPRRDARGPRERGPRERGPRDGKRRDSRGSDANPVAAVGQTTGRRIYKQDVSPQVAAAQAEAAKKAAEDERRRKLKETQDKVTLILHPAPKAGKTKHKKKGRPLTAKEALKAKTAAKSKAKVRSEETPDVKDVALDPKWVSADGTSAADALKSAAAGAEALVKAWLDASNVAALAAAAQSAHKGRKAAKRALNVLRSRGVDIPKTEASPVAREEVHEIVALFIPPDSTGATFFSISQRQPGGRYHVVDVVVRSGVGVVHANSAKLAGKHIRGWQNRVEKQYGTKPVQVPTDWARHHVSEGRKLNDVSKQLVPLGYDSCATLLKPVPDTAPSHPLAHLLDGEPSAKDLEAAVAKSEELHAQPEFGSWLPDRPALDELLAKVGERVGPDGVKDSAKVDEAIRLEVAAATDRWFTPERRTLLADSMTDCAISVHAREGDDTAKRVVTVARAIRDAGLITSPPSEIPFLLHFFQKAVAYLVRQNQGQLRVPVPAQA